MPTTTYYGRLQENQGHQSLQETDAPKKWTVQTQTKVLYIPRITKYIYGTLVSDKRQKLVAYNVYNESQKSCCFFDLMVTKEIYSAVLNMKIKTILLQMSYLLLKILKRGLCKIFRCGNQCSPLDRTFSPNCAAVVSGLHTRQHNSKHPNACPSNTRTSFGCEILNGIDVEDQEEQQEIS